MDYDGGLSNKQAPIRGLFIFVTVRLKLVILKQGLTQYFYLFGDRP